MLGAAVLAEVDQYVEPATALLAGSGSAGCMVGFHAVGRRESAGS